MRKLVIAIDGPSGVGKSTLGKEISRRLGYTYIDSGAVYRAIGLKSIDIGVALDDSKSVARVAESAKLELRGDPYDLRVYLDGKDVSREIRTPEVSHAASVVATIPGVREAVVRRLREWAQLGGVVMDGRDIGTQVFPDADVKLFLVASRAERARRRWKEETGRGREVSLAGIRAELEERDRRDREREATPLVRAADAVLMDTTGVSLEAVIERALEIAETRG